jgi:hypothetical protein
MNNRRPRIVPRSASRWPCTNLRGRGLCGRERTSLVYGTPVTDSQVESAVSVPAPPSHVSVPSPASSVSSPLPPCSLSSSLRSFGTLNCPLPEPGIGKSRLLAELRRRFADRPVTLLEGYCRSYGRFLPYGPICDLLRQQCGPSPTPDPDVVATQSAAYVTAASRRSTHRSLRCGCVLGRRRHPGCNGPSGA